MYPKEHVRAKCNEHKVRGVQVNYKSAGKYVGSDEFELLAPFPLRRSLFLLLSLCLLYLIQD